MTDGSAFQLDKQVVVFVDLLGTSSRALDAKTDGKDKLLDLLKTIAAMKSDFDFDGHSQADGSYRFKISPAVSTFSDNIVLSFRVVGAELDGDEADFLEKMYLDMAMRLTREMVGKLAVEALNIGMLVRGGMTLGELYHQDGVVLGSGLVEAYELESRVSNYPRITISSSIYSRIHMNDRAGNMRCDKDGIWHLDYFRNLNLAAYQDKALAQHISDLVAQNIHSHEQSKKWNEFAKWHWLKSELADVKREIPTPSPESNILAAPTEFQVGK